MVMENPGKESRHGKLLKGKKSWNLFLIFMWEPWSMILADFCTIVPY